MGHRRREASRRHGLRNNTLTLPKLTITGDAQVEYGQLLAQRGQLAQYAASGAAFLLGLPFEQIAASVSGSLLYVSSGILGLVDWAVEGQRVIVGSSDMTETAVGVIQGTTSDSIQLDITPGFDVDRVMPGVPVYLDPQQGFSRYDAQGSPEKWSISAKAAMFGYQSASFPASVVLSGYTTGQFKNATAVWNYPGGGGNGASLTLVSDPGISPNEYAQASGQAISYYFDPAITTVGKAVAQLLPWFIFYGSFNPYATIGTSDVFGPAALTGGLAKSWGTMGNGATVTTYSGRAVWDRGVGGANASDSIQTLADIDEYDGLPSSTGTANVPDWGRGVALERKVGPDWQWLKAFLYAVGGRYAPFWLPTWRADLVPVSLAPGTLTVAYTPSFAQFFPSQRGALMITTPNGATQYVTITGYSVSGGNISIAITSSNTAYNPGGSGTTVTPTLVSWLECCRFEDEKLSVSFDNALTLSFKAKARAIQDPGTVTDAQAGPREFFQIGYGSVNYYIATGDRDIVYGGITYAAQPGTRSAAAIETSSSTPEVTINLPTSHPLLQRWTSMGSPPQLVTATVYRLLASGTVSQQWTGVVTSVGIEGHVAKFLVRSLTGRMKERSLPLVLADTQCSNVLYDTRCRANPAAFAVTTTATSVEGPLVTVASVGSYSYGAFQRGALKHVPSGNTMFITSQPDSAIASALTLQAPIPELKVGDAVVVYCGCDQQIDTCLDLFNNVVNFGGLPNRPTKDPFVFNSQGVKELNPLRST